MPVGKKLCQLCSQLFLAGRSQLCLGEHSLTLGTSHLASFEEWPPPICDHFHLLLFFCARLLQSWPLPRFFFLASDGPVPLKDCQESVQLSRTELPRQLRPALVLNTCQWELVPDHYRDLKMQLSTLRLLSVQRSSQVSFLSLRTSCFDSLSLSLVSEWGWWLSTSYLVARTHRLIRLARFLCKEVF